MKLSSKRTSHSTRITYQSSSSSTTPSNDERLSNTWNESIKTSNGKFGGSKSSKICYRVFPLIIIMMFMTPIMLFILTVLHNDDMFTDFYRDNKFSLLRGASRATKKLLNSAIFKNHREMTYWIQETSSDLRKNLKKYKSLQTENIVNENSSESMSNKASPKLHIVTYASHMGSDDRFCRAIESAFRHDINILILGWNVKWEGLSQKLRAAYDFSQSIPDTDIILFTDAFDILYTQSADYILKEFLKINHTILFSAECGCWPHVMEDKDICINENKGYPKSPTPYRYLNSGSWIGYAKESGEMLQSVIQEAGSDFANANDQKLIADYFISKRFGIKLDYFNRIFQAMHMTLDAPLPYCNPLNDIVMKDLKWYNMKTKGYPAVFHFNGGGKVQHLPMERDCWYKKSPFNDAKSIEALSQKLFRTLPLSSKNLTFVDVCGDYIQKEYKIS